LRRPLESAQYAAADYRKTLKTNGIIQSMSRKGNCWDNAPVESFFCSMKTELDVGQRYTTREDAKRGLFAYIETSIANLHDGIT
jgi:putative transposase